MEPPAGPATELAALDLVDEQRTCPTPQGRHPEVPGTTILDNPYQYTDVSSGETHRA